MTVLKLCVTVFRSQIRGVLDTEACIVDIDIGEVTRPVVFSPEHQPLGEALLDFQLELVEVAGSRVSCPINAAPGLERTLLLNRHVGLLDMRFVDVDIVLEQMVALVPQIGGAKRPVFFNLPFYREVPLLRYRVHLVTVHHSDGGARGLTCN